MKQHYRLVLFMALTILCTAFMLGGGSFGDSVVPEATREAREQLEGITGEEKQTVAELFKISSEIELMATQISKLNEEIESLRVDVTEKQKQIDLETDSYNKAKNNMAEVLRAQQRAGAASSVNILLSAKNLKDLIHRINLLRDISKNTGNLMNRIDEARIRLTAEQQSLSNILKNIEEQQRLVKAAYDRQTGLKQNLERRLASLKSERGHYEAYLQTVEDRWTHLKPLFSETVSSFNAIIEAGGLPPDTVVMTYSLFYSKGRFEEGKFNRALAAREDLPKLVFGLKRDRVTLDFPEYQVTLSGRFELVNGQAITYKVEGGTFYNLPMSDSALKDLFSEGDLVFNLKSMIGNYNIRRIDHGDGYVEMVISGRP